MSEEKTIKGIPSFLHPLTGLLILVADWFFFSGAMASGLLAHAALFGFIVGFGGATYIQRFISGESWNRALLKGLISGALVGFPVPIGGTIIGGLILAFSGLDQLRQQAARALAEKTAEPRVEEDGGE
jgi:hypothetical protein